MWLKRASFSRDLAEVRLEAFNVADAFSDAATQLPFLNPRFAESLQNAGKKSAATDYTGALAGLGVFIAASSVVFLRRIKPE